MPFVSNPILDQCAGFSLGASVAEICALDLLHEAHKKREPPPHLQVIGFAAPAIGNAALAEYVEQRQWQSVFKNYVTPGRLTLQLKAKTQQEIYM